MRPLTLFGAYAQLHKTVCEMQMELKKLKKEAGYL